MVDAVTFALAKAALKDQKGIKLNKIRIPAEGDARAVLPVMAIAKRNSTVALVRNNGAPPPISWITRVIDTGGCWSASAQTRITVPPARADHGGAATVAWPTGVGATVREVFVTHFYGIGQTISTEVGRISVLPTGLPRTQYVTCVVDPHVAQEGDYYVVSYYDAGLPDLNLVQDRSRFRMERIGSPRGKWDGASFSADFEHRGD
jgi:hypothetical protein